MITVACIFLFIGVATCAGLQDAKPGFKLIGIGLLVLACKVLP